MTSRSPARDARGFILPVVLLLLLAASGLATAALVVARTEVLMERGDLAYVLEKLRWKASVAGGGPSEPHRRSLGGGFMLVRGGEGAAMEPAKVVWMLDPDSLAASLPPAAEVGWGTPELRIAEGDEDECGPPSEESPVRVRPGPSLPPPDPGLDVPPRLGPAGISSLVPRASVRLSTGDPLPQGETATLVEAVPGSRLSSGKGTGVLLAAGSLVLAGDTRWRGLVLVEGSLTLEDQALLEGAALVGERLRLLDESWLVGCRAAAAVALRAEALAEPFPLAGGSLLGRF